LNDLAKDTNDKHTEGIFDAWVYHVNLDEQIQVSEPMFLKVSGPRGEVSLFDKVRGNKQYAWEMFAFKWDCMGDKPCGIRDY